MGVDIAYKELLLDILDNGEESDDRTGVGTISTFGKQMKIPLSGLKLPAISLRKVAPRIAFEELMFMLNGKTQTKELEAKGINIWKGNTGREFLDSRGLRHLEDGDMGKMYGAQLRGFNGSIVGKFANCNTIVFSDQLEYMADEIKTNPTSRRIIATHYNPAEAHLGVLFPCHIMTQFNVRQGKYLDCLFWIRSSDVGFGLPYNLMYYGFFCHFMAKLCGLQAGNLVYQAGDAHIYKNQLESGMIDYMFDSDCREDPTISINKEFTTLEEMLELQWEDIVVHDYNPHPDYKDKPPMAV